MRVALALALALGTARADGLFDASFPFRCSPRAEVACSGVLPPRAGSEAALVHGEAALGARIDTLEKARRSVRIQALIFRGDESGLRIAEVLKRRKRDGLDVRVIVDAASNLDWRTQWMYFDLKRAGIEVEGYEALYLEWLTAERKSDPLRANKRFHDKMWVVDAEDPAAAIAIVGGHNVANEYFRVGAGAKDRWRDQDVVLRGAIVADVAATFDRNYDLFKSFKARLSGFNPDNAWRLARGVSARIGRLGNIAPWIRKESSALVDAAAAARPKLELHPVAARFVQSRPRMDETFILQAYLDLIARAKKRIDIANAYVIPSRPLREALAAAARRGVRVTVVTNSPESNDIREVATVSRWLYRDLVTAGLAIHEWRGPAAGEGTLHAKFAVFDDEEALVGSYNLDPRSERLNSETVVVLRDPATASRLGRAFRDEILPRSAPVDAAAAERYRRPSGIEGKFKLLYALPLKEWL